MVLCVVVYVCDMMTVVCVAVYAVTGWFGGGGAWWRYRQTETER